jgi:quercetin dioxygenase-like cupin family protein
LILPHDEAEHGQEEVYVVLRGRARIEVDGEAHTAEAGDVLYARPGVLRAAYADEDDTLLLIVGGIPGTYSPPIWALDWRPPER